MKIVPDLDYLQMDINYKERIIASLKSKMLKDHKTLAKHRAKLKELERIKAEMLGQDQDKDKDGQENNNKRGSKRSYRTDKARG